MFLEYTAEGVFESHFKSHTEPVLTANVNYRIVREGVSQAKYRSLMIYFGLVVMFIVLSGWNRMIEPMTLRG